MILLTGVTGGAGSHIVREFVAADQPVRVLVSDRTKAGWLESIPIVKIVEGTCQSR